MTAFWRRGMMVCALAGCTLLLSACLLSPGKFTAALDLRKDGMFTYRYDGEIVMLGLSRLAQAGHSAGAAFKPEPCHADDDPAKPRPCNSTEIDDQKRQWATAREARVARDKQQGEQAKALLGGIDPTDPKAAEELAERLRKQAGWRSVVYKGDGVYLVSFALSGRLTHDFAFPTIERFPMANAFVTISRRADGSVRIDAPAFGGGGAMGQALAMGAMQGMGGAKDGAKPANFPVPDGRFTITTDAPVLANNTDDGPRPDPVGQRLEWLVNAQAPAAPMALLRLAQ